MADHKAKLIQLHEDTLRDVELSFSHIVTSVLKAKDAVKKLGSFQNNGTIPDSLRTKKDRFSLPSGSKKETVDAIAKAVAQHDKKVLALMIKGREEDMLFKKEKQDNYLNEMWTSRFKKLNDSLPSIEKRKECETILREELKKRLENTATLSTAEYNLAKQKRADKLTKKAIEDRKLEESALTTPKTSLKKMIDDNFDEKFAVAMNLFMKTYNNKQVNTGNNKRNNSDSSPRGSGYKRGRGTIRGRTPGRGRGRSNVQTRGRGRGRGRGRARNNGGKYQHGHNANHSGYNDSADNSTQYIDIDALSGMSD